MPHLWQLNDYHQAPACCKKPWTCHCITRLHSLEYLLRAVRNRRPLPSNGDTFKRCCIAHYHQKQKQPGWNLDFMRACLSACRIQCENGSSSQPCLGLKVSTRKLPSFRFIAPLWLLDEESSGLALDGDHDPCSRRLGSNQNNQQEIILPHFLRQLFRHVTWTHQWPIRNN